MDLHVKKFKVRYQGQDYGPGTVIYGVPDDIAKELINGSNGAIEALPDRQPVAETANQDEKQSGKNKIKASDDTALPSVDPSSTVK
ncbi:MAG: hypothetical protein H6Q73_3454 [Firmicutes bacterium]|nr:hypothetical protein [Bacillota bacterium]